MGNGTYLRTTEGESNLGIWTKDNEGNKGVQVAQDSAFVEVHQSPLKDPWASGIRIEKRQHKQDSEQPARLRFLRYLLSKFRGSIPSPSGASDSAIPLKGRIIARSPLSPEQNA